MLKRLSAITVRALINRNIAMRVTRRRPRLLTTATFGGTAGMINLLGKDKLIPYDPENEEVFVHELKLNMMKNDEAMRDLIQTLNGCVEEICEQYQHCVLKQIEITMTGMDLGALGKHWDDLTKYRVEADDLRHELEKYEQLVERMGHIIYHEQENEVENNTKFRKVRSDYEELKNMLRKKVEENKYWDSKLLDVNKQSILGTVVF